MGETAGNTKPSSSFREANAIILGSAVTTSNVKLLMSDLPTALGAMSGTGKVFLSSYGAIHQVDLAPGQRYTVDTGHMVAFDEGTGYKVKRVGGLKSTLFSGEGLVVEFTGPGRVLVQSRSPEAFLSWLIPRLPARRSD